jgi:hypothetical protein
MNLASRFVLWQRLSVESSWFSKEHFGISRRWTVKQWRITVGELRLPGLKARGFLPTCHRFYPAVLVA